MEFFDLESLFYRFAAFRRYATQKAKLRKSEMRCNVSTFLVKPISTDIFFLAVCCPRLGSLGRVEFMATTLFMYQCPFQSQEHVVPGTVVVVGSCRLSMFFFVNYFVMNKPVSFVCFVP